MGHTVKTSYKEFLVIAVDIRKENPRYPRNIVQENNSLKSCEYYKKWQNTGKYGKHIWNWVFNYDIMKSLCTMSTKQQSTGNPGSCSWSKTVS